jgi:multidrug transporter EmrE-like cation transporter
MIVGSGAAHAIVNAVLKSGKDKMSSRALIDGFSALLMFPAAFFLPFPQGAWGWLAGSAVVHLVYLICLIKSFEAADMSVAYPIARGAAPTLAAAVAVTLFNEPINAWIACGIGLVSSGVLLIGSGRSVTRSAIGWAMATGCHDRRVHGHRCTGSARGAVGPELHRLDLPDARRRDRRGRSRCGADRASCWRPAPNGAPACLPARCRS